MGSGNSTPRDSANSTSCGAFLQRGRSFRLLPGPMLALDEMIRCLHIQEEFQGLRMSVADVKTIIRASTKEVKQVTSLHPILLIGYGGQGKSSLTNKVLDEFGTSVDGRRAKVGHRCSMTKNVDVYACSHTTSVGDGQVHLLDTEGFSPGGTQQVLEQCERVILDQGVSKEVFRQRLVFVLVIGANAQGQRLAGADELSNVVKALAEKFCIGGDQVKPRMLVVLTHCDDMHQEERLRQDVYNDVRGIVDKAVGTKMAVEPPLFVSGLTGEGISTLVARLKEVAEESLNSPELLGVIRRLLSANLVKAVQQWALMPKHSGLEASETLARRCAFAIALLYGARWDNFYEKVTWEDVGRLMTQLQGWKRPNSAEKPGARYHEDNLRCCTHTPSLSYALHEDDLESLAESTTSRVASHGYVSLRPLQDEAACNGPSSPAGTRTGACPLDESPASASTASGRFDDYDLVDLK